LSVPQKISHFSINLVTCYLPPENTGWGRDCTNVYAHLTTLLYMCTTVDLIMFSGDFISRIGDFHDCIDDVNEILNRSILDNQCNKHGK